MPLAHGTVEVWSVTVFHAVSVLIAALWMISMVKDGNIRFYRTPLDLPILIFIVLACLSVFISVYPYASRIQLYKVINYAFIFYFVLNTSWNKQELLNLTWFAALFGGIYAIAGVTLVGGELAGFRFFSSYKMISLTFVNHNHFAGLMEMVTMLCVALALAYKGSRRALFICVGAVAATAVFFSLSRGGVLGLLGGVSFFFLVMAFCKGRKKNFLLLTSFMVLVALLIAALGRMEYDFARLYTLKTPIVTGKTRFEIWEGVLDMIKGNLWFGTGIGTFQYSYPRYKTDSLEFFIKHAHNDYLEMMAEMGIVGIFSVLLVVTILFAYCIKRLIILKDIRLQAVGIGSLAGCFAILIHGGFDFNLHVPSNASFLMVSAAMALAAANSGGSDTVHGSYNIFINKRFKVYLLALFIFSALSALVISVYLGNTYLHAAKDYKGSKKYDAAAAALKKAIFIDPGNAMHLVAMGDLMLTRSVNSRGPDDRRSYLVKSLKYYDHAIDVSPVRSYYYSKKADVLKRLGRSEDELKALERAVYFYPMSSFAHYDLGEFYLKQNELDNAFSEYKRFLELLSYDKYFDNYMYDKNYNDNLQSVLDRIWDINSDYETLKKVVPENSISRIMFSNYLLKKEELNAAAQERNFALSFEPTLNSSIVILQGLSNAGEYQMASKMGGEYLLLFDNDMSIQTIMASVYKRLGDNEKSNDLYQQLYAKKKQLIEGGQEIHWLYKDLAGLYVKTERYEEAIKTLKAGVERWPEDRKMRYTLQREIADDYVRKGQYGMAIPIKQQLINEGYAPHWLYKDLARLYLKTERYEDAIKTLKAGVERWPEDAKFYNILAIIYDKLKLPEKALESRQSEELLKSK
jgi:O-antigen ligase/tetratricopeptide (TPR) repeat protein